VIHGGTNFGYTAGANAFSPTQYQPDLTSYDYDAPIDESGNATPKYHMLRRLIEQYTGKPAPPIPAPVKHISIPTFSMQPAHSLFDYAPKVHASAQPQPMEYYGQNQGFIVYRTKLIGHKSGRLKIWEPHDYALVYLDGEFIDTVYRDGGNWEVQLPKTNSTTPELTIVVEGMGHINFAQFMIDRKGITDRVTLNGMTLMNWQTQLLPVDEAFMQQPFPKAVSASKQNGDFRFFTGEFSLTETGDTYLDLSGYSKGVVFVNGRLLGRYWNLGPQYRLYCPATWLKKGQNKIVVMDLHQSTAAAIAGFTSML